MYETRLNAVDRWLQGLLTWTPGQTDIIKTVALVLMIVDHTGLLLAGNNELMRLLGRGCFPLFGLVWGMNLARHGAIRQTGVSLEIGNFCTLSTLFNQFGYVSD